ncbi:hypothetical protein POZ19_00085 [Ralstonia wenshanensis]
MARRLQDVLSKLYRPPPDGVKQVFALARADAERLPQLASIAIISITSPERPPANLGGFAHVLRMSFADVDFLNTNLSERARGKVPYAFTEEQSYSIRSFVESLPAEIRSVVIHCEGGYSRSCAVALALHRVYGFHAELSHLAQANPSIVTLMTGDGYARRVRTKPNR